MRTDNCASFASTSWICIDTSQHRNQFQNNRNVTFLHQPRRRLITTHRRVRAMRIRPTEDSRCFGSAGFVQQLLEPSVSTIHQLVPVIVTSGYSKPGGWNEDPDIYSLSNWLTCISSNSSLLAVCIGTTYYCMSNGTSCTNATDKRTRHSVVVTASRDHFRAMTQIWRRTVNHVTGYRFAY